MERFKIMKLEDAGNWKKSTKSGRMIQEGGREERRESIEFKWELTVRDGVPKKGKREIGWKRDERKGSLIPINFICEWTSQEQNKMNWSGVWIMVGWKQREQFYYEYKGGKMYSEQEENRDQGNEGTRKC